MFKNVKRSLSNNIIPLLFVSFYLIYDNSLQKNKNKIKTYNLSEVEKHDRLDDFWVTYKNSVYNITSFVNGHPGGVDKIEMAAGSRIDPFWELYPQHKNPEVIELLEKNKIGELIDNEVDSTNGIKVVTESDVENIANNIPLRSRELKIHTNKPINAETPLKYLTNSYLTSNSLWYIRNLHSTPKINADNYTLTLSSSSNNNKNQNKNQNKNIFQLKLSDLQQFKRHQVTTTMQCAGNRRREFITIRPVHGTNWEGGAIGTACWEGVYLLDILTKYGMINHKNKDKGKYLTIWGYDEDFRISISMKKY